MVECRKTAKNRFVADIENRKHFQDEDLNFPLNKILHLYSLPLFLKNCSSTEYHFFFDRVASFKNSL